MNAKDSLVARLLAPAGGVVADVSLIEAAREAVDKIEGLEEDLKSAVTIAWKYGAKDWARMNYPRLAASLDKHTDKED